MFSEFNKFRAPRRAVDRVLIGQQRVRGASTTVIVYHQATRLLVYRLLKQTYKLKNNGLSSFANIIHHLV